MKRERKVQGQEQILAKHLDGLERNDCFDFKKTTQARLSEKKDLSPTSKATWEASRNEFMENGGMPDRVKSFREINSKEDRPRAWPGFVKPIQNGPRKIKNLI